MTRTLLLMLCAISPLLCADELQVRVTLDAEVLDGLMQAERWAIIDAQNFAAKGQHRRAAVEFEKFTTTFPDSELWAFAVYSGSWHLFRDRRYEAASERLEEMIEIGDGSPEIPEAKLLLGRCRLEAGDAAGAIAALRDLIEAHPGSSASIPARVLASRGTLEVARMKGVDAKDVAAARLSLLGPLAEDIVVDERNGPDLVDGLQQLADLALASGDHQRQLDLLRVLVAADGDTRRQELRRLRWDYSRKLMSQAADAGQDGIVAKAATIRWTDAAWRAIGESEFHLDWSEGALRDPKRMAEQRGVSPEALKAWVAERDAALVERIAGLLEVDQDGDRRQRLGWTSARLLLRTGAEWAAAEAAIDRGFGGRWDGKRAYEAFEFAIRRDVDAAQASAVAARVEDEAQRAEVRLRILEYRAGRLDDREAATAAIALCEDLARSDDGDGVSYLYRMAKLHREPLGDWDAAIAIYEGINQPPKTDLAIAECLGRKGDWKGAFGRYGSVYAMSPGDVTGADALVRMGKIANEHLKDRVRSIQLLRQVCDDFPDTRQYSDAHVYLQHELGVTYTGGGGGAKTKR